MPTESSTRTKARMSGTHRFERAVIATHLRRSRGRIASDHRGAKVGELVWILRGAGVMRAQTAMLGRKAERNRHVEVGECIHLAVEPVERIRPETVGP